MWIIGAALIVMAAAAAICLLLFPRGGSAQEHALAYLRALENGDLTAIEATGLDVPPDTAAAFTGADEYISEVAVEASTESDAAPIVRASFTLADERRDVEISMIEAHGRWVPDPATAFGTVLAQTPVGVGETVFAADAAVTLLPAQYELSASPAEFLEGTAVVQATPATTQNVALEVALRPEATERAGEQLAQHLEVCTRSAAEVPESCGIAVPWAADFSALSEVSYRIEQPPVISLTLSSFHADEGVLVATVTGTDIDGETAKTASYRTTNWSLRGDVDFTAVDIVLSVW